VHASPARLFAGGLVGPFAACFCIIGFWHVYLNIRSSSVPLARLVLILFSMLMVAGSAVHTLWTAKGLALKYCYGQAAPCSDLLAATKSYRSLAYTLGAIPGYMGAALLFGLVLLGKTAYPRWTVLANPAAVILLSPFADLVPAPLGAILVGGFSNLSIAFFFLVSLSTTWHRRPGV
jgi:energy-coupling factor transporter transmembrane protein EcfT